MEFILTLGLVSVILGTASGAQNIGIVGAFGVGAYIALAGLWGSPISGASMNPARTFGPDLVGADFSHYWVYVAGPIAGAAGAVLFGFVLRGRGGGRAGLRRRTRRTRHRDRTTRAVVTDEPAIARLVMPSGRECRSDRGFRLSGSGSASLNVPNRTPEAGCRPVRPLLSDEALESADVGPAQGWCRALIVPAVSMRRGRGPDGRGPWAVCATSGRSQPAWNQVVGSSPTRPTVCVYTSVDP